MNLKIDFCLYLKNGGRYIPRRKQESYARDLRDEIKPTFVGLLYLSPPS